MRICIDIKTGKQKGNNQRDASLSSWTRIKEMGSWFSRRPLGPLLKGPPPPSFSQRLLIPVEVEIEIDHPSVRLAISWLDPLK